MYTCTSKAILYTVCLIYTQIKTPVISGGGAVLLCTLYRTMLFPPGPSVYAKLSEGNRVQTPTDAQIFEWCQSSYLPFTFLLTLMH